MIQIIVTIFQGLAAATTIILFAIKPFRYWFLGIKERKKEEAAEREAVMGLIRSDITRIYYKNSTTCEIRQYEYENLSRLYGAYKKLGGNSFVDKIWDEVQEWTIVR